MLTVAKEAGEVRGYILISKGWNNYAVIDDFAVDRNIRRAGIGTRLMDQAVEWAKEHGLPGLRLETQSNNVQACRFYRKYGFDLGGHDKYLYTALEQSCSEIALFWYLKFARLL